MKLSKGQRCRVLPHFDEVRYAAIDESKIFGYQVMLQQVPMRIIAEILSDDEKSELVGKPVYYAIDDTALKKVLYVHPKPDATVNIKMMVATWSMI